MENILRPLSKLDRTTEGTIIPLGLMGVDHDEVNANVSCLEVPISADFNELYRTSQLKQECIPVETILPDSILTDIETDEMCSICNKLKKPLIDHICIPVVKREDSDENTHFLADFALDRVKRSTITKEVLPDFVHDMCLSNVNSTPSGSVVKRGRPTKRREKCLKRHVCSFCQRKWPSLSLLKKHELSHTKTPQSCEHCGRTFTSTRVLNSHRKTHTVKDVPYQCKICKKSFHTTTELVKHWPTHEDETSSAPQLDMAKVPRRDCDEKLSSPSGLLVHFENMHKSKQMFECPHCAKVFKGKRNLTSHLLTHPDKMPNEDSSIEGKKVKMQGKKERTTTRGSWTAEQLDGALAAICDQGVSVKGASRLYGIPRGTLLRRLTLFRAGKMVDSNPILGRFSPVFTPQQEKMMVEHAQHMKKHLLPLTRNEFRHHAYRFAVKLKLKHPFNSEVEMAGKDFFVTFLQRYPELKEYLK